MVPNAVDILAVDGPFSDLLTGFLPRKEQLEMAELVETALDNKSTLIVEAGTGVGKTFAYLVPAFLSNKKVIISTGTKNLQDQLYLKDVPLVRDAVARGLKVSLLKGRANYLCIKRLRDSIDMGHFQSQELISQLQDISRWSLSTQTGDRSELTQIPEDAMIWSSASSTADNCLGSDCPDFSDCFVSKARKQAQEADIVVINHHLFFADLALKEDGFGELLPSAEAFIFDEAHQLAEVASSFFGVSLSSRQLKELCTDSINAQLAEAPESAEIRQLCDAVEKASKDLRLALGHADQRQAWRSIQHKPAVKIGLDELVESVKDLAVTLESMEERGKALEQCHRRCQEIVKRIAQFQDVPTDFIAWYESFSRGFSLHLTPLDISKMFDTYMHSYVASWVFTSATLAIGEKFNYFTERMGVFSATEKRLESPFDYQRNALLYLPKDMPLPNDQSYTQAVVDAAMPVLKQSGGRCFMLFTSYRALNEAEKILTKITSFPLLKQGEMPRNLLLDEFKRLGNAILLGTSSFWEGVDVRGDALSLVIIDKLPFASPGDPVLKERLNQMEQQGKNAFMDYQVPQAVIALKQGAGRLIRDVTDRGVLMICDPRLTTKPYGKTFLKSLPNMPSTHDVEDVTAFYQDE
ncbi:MAG: ATP-dependent DNA helicase [Gammaproteobacteria bacterium]|nr:ATP-dependent DNA helicase [Gammaproteobacteria bacterium]